MLEERNRSDGRAAAAGYIINTMGWVDGLGFDLLLHTIEALQADVICVVGQDRLHAQLSRHFSTPSSLRRVDVVQVPRSGGVVIRDTDTRKSSRQKRVRDYFHGSHGQLRPYSQSLPLKELQIFQVGSAAGSLPSSALPIGAKPVSDPLKTTRVLPSDLKGRVLAVTYAKGEGEILSR